MAEKPGRPTATKKRSSKVFTINTYAAQCNNCFKWRFIDTEEEYVAFRSNVAKEPFVCGSSKPGVSCEDPADVELKTESSFTWVIDKPGIPKPPEGFERILVPRKDFSKIDVYYLTPMKKRVKCFSELKSFKEANPEYKDLPLDDFNFTAPKVVDVTIPSHVVKKKVPGDGKAES